MEEAKRRIAVVYDAAAGREKNRNGENDWDVYLPEILGQAGFAADILPQDFTPEAVQQYRVLLVGSVSLAGKSFLRDWMRSGGTLICFSTPGCEEWTDVQTTQRVKQHDDIYTIAANLIFRTQEMEGYFRLKEHCSLPVISDYRLIEVQGEHTVLADLLKGTIGGIFGWEKTGTPAVVQVDEGAGCLYYFAFDLCQTMLVLHQGRRVDRDYDGDGYYRTGDAIVLTRAHNLNCPVSDYYLHLLTGMISRGQKIGVYQLPATPQGEVPDFVLHYGGDDEGDQEYQMIASRVMKARGLPYHVNLMLRDGKFAVDEAQFQELIDNGTVPSIHFDFYRPHTFYTQADVNEQLDAYEAAFHCTPVVSANHVLMFTGWAEHARWCSERGMKGDNSKVHTHLMPAYNPINEFGMPFGSTYPSFVYDDAAHDNRALTFADLPIGLYEPRVFDESKEKDQKNLTKILERADYFAFTLSVFLHPVYLAKEPACVAAVDFILDEIKRQGYCVHHMSNDALCLWWFDRREVSISGVPDGGYLVDTGKADHIVLRMDTQADYCLIDGVQTKGRRKAIAGREWLLCSVPKGKHRVHLPV